MIPANPMTVAEMACSFAIELAEMRSKRYHRLAFWVPFRSRDFQMLAKIWDYELARLKKHALTLGTGAKSRKALPEIVDVCIPARAEHLFSVGE